MPEIKLYLNDNVHTGQIREATCLLAYDTLGIVDDCLNKIRDLENSQVDLNAESALRLMILKPDNLPNKKIRRWEKDESSVVKLLNLAHQFTNRDKIDQKLVTTLEPRTIPQRTMDALVFFGTMKERLKYLSSDQGQLTHPTIVLAGASLIESRILHQALYGKRYLVRVSDSSAA